MMPHLHENGGPLKGSAVDAINDVCIWRSGRFVSGVADLVEGSFDELFALVAEAVIDGGHRLDDTGGGSGERELAVFHFALIEGEGTVTQHDEAAVGEFTGVILVEIEDDFFVGKLVVADFHMDFR
jgi:hypothetical protein